jgi:hypothetical protein
MRGMKTAMNVTGTDVSTLLLDSATVAAIAGLEWQESHFILQKVAEAVPWNLADELEKWMKDELHGSGCDIAKVARMAEAYRQLVVVGKAQEDEFNRRLQTVQTDLNSGELKTSP